MRQLYRPFGFCLLLFALAVAPLRANNREHQTIDFSCKVMDVITANPVQGIPPVLLREAKAVAIIPGVVKAGLLVDGRFGRGVILLRQPNGSWSNPVFITLTGHGIGLQAGVESTDVVLVFRSQKSVDHILRGNGRLTLGGEAAVAVGPVGGESEAALNLRQVEVYSYTRNRGLFLGVSLEGDRLQVDGGANEAFYSIRHCGPNEVLAHHGIPAAEGLRNQMYRLTMPLPHPEPHPVPHVEEHRDNYPH